MSISPVVKGRNDKGEIEYHLTYDFAWEGLDSLIKYLETHWNAVVSETNDGVDSRRWVARVNEIPISIYHDGQMGNYFLREDGQEDQSLLELIEADLVRRMS